MNKKILSTVLALMLTAALGFGIPDTAFAGSSGGSGSSNEKSISERISELTYDEAKALIKQGSYGFFDFMGSEKACKALKNGAYSSSNSIGSSNDATSLKNMKASLSYIKKANELRAGEGRPAFRVTDYMMATAQANANASASRMRHLHQFDVGENLAWGLEYPWNTWWTKEKSRYRSGGSGTSHYRNLIRPWASTGFGINQKGPYGFTCSQTFSYSGGSGYTLKKYTERFNEYFNALGRKVTQKTELTALKDVKTGFKANWKRKKYRVDGYEIRYSVWKDMHNSNKVKISGDEKTSMTVSDAKAGKTYFVQIRTYHVINGAVFYSGWSKKENIHLS